jgi:hypothetical protein
MQAIEPPEADIPVKSNRRIYTYKFYVEDYTSIPSSRRVSSVLKEERYRIVEYTCNPFSRRVSSVLKFTEKLLITLSVF